MFSKILEKIKRILSTLGNMQFMFAFFAHNRKFFLSGSHHRSASPIILMELNFMHSAHIAYAYLADELARQSGAQIKAYAPKAISCWRRRLFFRLKAALGWAEFGAYKSFGVNEFIEIRLDEFQYLRAHELHTLVLGRIKGTRDIEDLHVDGVWIGDLVYDTFLMNYKQPTIDHTLTMFRDFLLESMELFVFWDDYLRNHDVRGLNVSHCVYNLAIPLRIAVLRGISVFQVNATHVYRLNKDNLFAYNDFFHFPESFAALPLDVREAGIALAESRIARRFAGEVGVDMNYSSKSAYGVANNGRQIRESLQKKILIATHCFFDSPHSYGKNTFPDFYEWLEFLGEMSERKDYDWYIKMHPDFLPGTEEIILGLVTRFPKLTLLPSNTSHLQIIAEGIDVALTSYGTIAFEYAALGVPVINASINNPHIAYGFNLHARDVEHYRELLEDLDNLKLKINRSEVYEYYFMRYIYNTEDLFFEDYNKAIADMGGYYAQFTPLAYRQWLNNWSIRRHEEIVKALHDFVLSGKFRMDYNYYGRELSASSLVADTH